MKKILLILFSVTFMFMIAGCGDTTSSSSQNSSNSGNTGGGGDTGGGDSGSGDSGSGDSGGGDSGGGEVEDPFKTQINNLIGEYKVTAIVVDENVEQNQKPEAYVRINSQDYNTLLIEYKLSIDGSLFVHHKVFSSNPKEFMKTYITSTGDKTYDFLLPTGATNVTYTAKIEKQKSFNINEGINPQGKVIKVIINDNKPVTEDKPKEIPVSLNYDNVQSAKLKIYGTKVIGNSLDIFNTDLEGDDRTTAFNEGSEVIVVNTATFSVTVNGSLNNFPDKAYLFDVITGDSANTFGILKVDIKNK